MIHLLLLSAISSFADVSHSIQWANEPLTLERVWSLEPEEKNPAHLRWAIDREVILRGLVSLPKTEKKQNGFGVEAKGGVYLKSIIYLKEKGPWYASPADFLCSKKRPKALWIGTLESTRWLAEKSAQVWEAQVQKSSPELQQSLKAVFHIEKSKAVQMARLRYRQWLLKLERTWHEWQRDQALELEWEYLIQNHSISKSGCLEFKKPEQYRESVSPEGVKPEQAMLPMKWMGSHFTVKSNLDIGDRRLNGRFLIDPLSEKNRVGSDWLSSQGIEPRVFALSALGEKNRWRGKTSQLSPILVDRFEASGFELPIQNMWVGDSFVWMSDDATQTCCSGVLGEAFLRAVVLKFEPGLPEHFKIWKRESAPVFQSPNDSSWGWAELRWDPLSKKALVKAPVKASEQNSHRMISVCEHQNRPITVEWSFEAKTNSKNKSTKKIPIYDIHCGSFRLSSSWFEPIGKGQSRIQVGFEFFKSNAWALDLSHQRIWIKN